MGTKTKILIASGAAAACLIITLMPVRLKVTMKSDTYEYDSLTRDDITVKEESLVGIGFNISNYGFKKQTTNASNDIYVNWAYLSEKTHISNIRATGVESRYTGDVYEGDAFDASRVETVLVYANGYEQPIDKADYQSPETIGTDTYIPVHTDYGDAVMSFSLIRIKEIDADYEGEIKEGDPLDTNEITVKKVFEDGKKETITDFKCTDTDAYARSGNSSGVWTSYGRTPLILNPIAITGAYMDGTFYEGERVSSGNVTICYADGTKNAVDFSDIELSENTVLKEGINELPFTYHGTNHTLYISAQTKTEAMQAAEDYAGEVENAVRSVKTSSLFATVTDHGNYMLAHVVVNKPSQFTDVTTQAIIGVGAGVATTDSLGSQAANAVTTGHEICMTFGGTLFSPGKGYSLRGLSTSEVIFSCDTYAPLLIQDGILYNEGDTDGMGGVECNAVAMVKPGEYYLLTTQTSMTYAQMQNVFSNLGCYYARAITSTPCMMIQSEVVAGSSVSGNLVGFYGG